MKRLKRFLAGAWRCVLLPLISLVLILLLIGGVYTFVKRQQTARDIVITAANGVQSLEQVSLGGIDQWISIRGLDADNPVLLFVHGGPGASEMVPVRHYNRVLEDHFVVVNWDQRGAGKSFSADIPPETMTLDRITADALELTVILRERFNVEKIYLAGHSWGSIVGVHAAVNNPKYYYAYIGIGQAVNFVEAEKISYRFTVDRARETGNEEALRELQTIGPPPYSGDDFLERTGVQRKWLFRFGGEVYGETNNTRYLLDLLWLYLQAPEYSIIDTVNLVRGNQLSARMMWDDLMALDLPRQAPAIEVPVYFLTGRHDYVTVYEKVEEYYAVLEAPSKELIWFEESAHSPNFEQPEEFARVMARILEETRP